MNEPPCLFLSGLTFDSWLVFLPAHLDWPFYLVIWPPIHPCTVFSWIDSLNWHLYRKSQTNLIKWIGSYESPIVSVSNSFLEAASPALGNDNIFSWNLQAMAIDEVTTPKSHPNYERGISNIVRKRVRDADPNKGHCLVTNHQITIGVEYCEENDERRRCMCLSTDIYSGFSSNTWHSSIALNDTVTWDGLLWIWTRYNIFCGRYSCYIGSVIG